MNHLETIHSILMEAPLHPMKKWNKSQIMNGPEADKLSDKAHGSSKLNHHKDAFKAHRTIVRHLEHGSAAGVKDHGSWDHRAHEWHAGQAAKHRSAIEKTGLKMHRLEVHHSNTGPHGTKEVKVHNSFGIWAKSPAHAEKKAHKIYAKHGDTVHKIIHKGVD